MKRREQDRWLLRVVFGLLLCFGGLAAAGVRLAWDANPPHENVNRYRIHWGKVGSGVTNVVTVTNVTISPFLELEPGALHWFFVTAVSFDHLESDPSQVLTYTESPAGATPKPATNLLEIIE